MIVLLRRKKFMEFLDFFDIRKFADIDEVPQKKVILFANQVAELVAEIAGDYHRAVNKNIGHMFSLI